MTPFAGIHPKGSKERIFNYRLSRARRVVENAFGIMSAKFRVLRSTMILSPKSAKTIVLATVHLHNFLRRDSLLKKTNDSTIETATFTPNQFITTPSDIRIFLSRYFMTNGSIDWQERY